jgi:hypothetical protein
VDDTSDVSVKTTGSLRDNAWHHVAAVYDAPTSQARLFIDGTKKITKVMVGPGIDKPAWLLDVGALVSGTRVDKSFVGTFDLVAVSEYGALQQQFRAAAPVSEHVEEIHPFDLECRRRASPAFAVTRCAAG